MEGIQPNLQSVIVQKQQEKQNLKVRNFQREIAKDNNYYLELKNFFNLGLDFLDLDQKMNRLKVVDYYEDGTINQYYVKSFKELENRNKN